MNNQPLVSVIVPVYKAEGTIQRCLDSLLAQTLKDFEVILVDDGSPDRCGEICEEYAQIDSRIKVIHQKNQGVSAARQNGLNTARGEYVIHTDADDWVENNAFEEMYKKAKADEADIVICDFFEDDSIYHKQEPTALDYKTLQIDMVRKIHGNCWSKLIRRKCINQYNVQFPKMINFAEDTFFLCSLLQYDIKATYLPKAFYHYVQNVSGNSLARSYNAQTYQNDLKLIGMLETTFKNNPAGIPYMRRCYVMTMIKKAFYNGKGYYDAKLFNERFNHYKKFVWQNGTLKDRMFVFTSCLGYYNISYGVYSLLYNFYIKMKLLWQDTKI